MFKKVFQQDKSLHISSKVKQFDNKSKFVFKVNNTETGNNTRKNQLLEMENKTVLFTLFTDISNSNTNLIEPSKQSKDL